MAETEKYKSTKRFGARYGRRLKERFGKIESVQRSKQKCPYCSALKVKRIAAGIWKCRNCNTKFAGKAYSVGKKITSEKTEPIEEKAVKEEVKLSNESEEDLGMSEKKSFSEHTPKSKILDDSKNLQKEVA